MAEEAAGSDGELMLLGFGTMRLHEPGSPQQRCWEMLAHISQREGTPSQPPRHAPG